MMKWLRRKFIALLGRYLPNRGKRIIYILLCYLIWSRNEDEKTIRNEFIEINNRLHLVNDNSALEFAIVLKDVLFKLDEFNRLKNIPIDEPVESVEKHLILSVPRWLTYDTIEGIKQDLRYVFKPRYRHQPTTSIV